MNSRKSHGGLTLQQGGDDPSCDLDWGEIENFGTDSEVGQFVQNNEDTQGYEDLQTAADVDVFRIFAKEQTARDRNEKKNEVFDNLTKVDRGPKEQK